MGMLSAFVDSGAGKFLEMRDEDRAEGREIAKEERQNKYEEIRAKRLQQFQTSERLAGQAFTAEQNELNRTHQATMQDDTQEHDVTMQDDSQEHATGMQDDQQEHATGMQDDQQEHSSEMQDDSQAFQSSQQEDSQAHQELMQDDTQQHQTSEREAGEEHEREMGVVVSSGSDLVTINENGEAELKYGNDDREGSGSSGQVTVKDAVKFFSAKAGQTYGTYANNSYSFKDKLDAQNASRAAALATQMWQRQGGAADPNSVWLEAHRLIEENPSMSGERLQQEMEELGKGWVSDDDEARIEEIQTELEKAQQDLWSLPGQGILGRYDTDGVAGSPKEGVGSREDPYRPQTRAERDAIPVGSFFMSKDEKGRDIIVRKGKPKETQDGSQ